MKMLLCNYNSLLFDISSHVHPAMRPGGRIGRKRWAGCHPTIETFFITVGILHGPGKDLNCHRVLMDRCRMLYISGNNPAFAKSNIRFLIFDSECHMSRNEITSLLMWVGVPSMWDRLIKVRK